jgi:hypothetical protein
MSLIGTCSDCGTGGVSLRYKPEVPVNEQSRPSICDRCRDFREEQATQYVRCEECGDRVPSERAHSLDVAAEDEYYPKFIHFCPTCRPDTNDDDAEIMTDGGQPAEDGRGDHHGVGVVCQDCPYQAIWYPVRMEREQCKHDLVHPHTVEYVDPTEVTKSVRMNGEVVVRHDEQATLVTDGGRSTEEYECPSDDCDYVGPAGTRDYYGATIYVCRRCGHEIPAADPDKPEGGRGD